MSLSPVRSRKRVIAEQSLPTPSNFDARQLRLYIEYVAPADLKAPARALRTHKGTGLKAIAASIKQFGFIVPMVVDSGRRIIAGHGRWLAAKSIGLDRVPVIEVSHLSDEQVRLLAVADNKIASMSEWDMDELRIELCDLAEIDLETGLNFEITGFSTAEIDDLLSIVPVTGHENVAEEDIPQVETYSVSAVGDLWQLGFHRLICGSSIERDTFERLLGTERAEMIFSDAPYNLPSKTISGNGRHQHGDFAMASGEMSLAEFTGFLRSCFSLLAKFSSDGSIHFQCMDHRHMREMLEAGYGAYSELKNLVVWKKHSAGMGSFYRSQHELIFVWKNGSAPHINNFGLGENGRYRTNVWEYRGNAGFHKERNDELGAHATVKPWSMVADAMRDCSKRGGIILDPFGGSGTTLIAAERTGRKARLIELDPLYCDVTIRRWQKLTGKDAVLAATGETFDQRESCRAPKNDDGELTLDDLGDEEAA